jgi:hypothetical protein
MESLIFSDVNEKELYRHGMMDEDDNVMLANTDNKRLYNTH